MGQAIRFCMCLIASAGLLGQAIHARANGPDDASVQPRPLVAAHAPSDALDLGLLTVANDLTYFAGQSVRIANVRIYKVISPRLFVIEPAGLPSSQMGRYDSRALVVLAAPATATLQRGTIVEVMGRPWSLFEAQLHHGDPSGLAELSKRDTRRFEHKAVIHADLVRTPGGIDLYAGH